MSDNKGRRQRTGKGGKRRLSITGIFGKDKAQVAAAAATGGGGGVVQEEDDTEAAEEEPAVEIPPPAETAGRAVLIEAMHTAGDISEAERDQMLAALSAHVHAAEELAAAADAEEDENAGPRAAAAAAGAGQLSAEKSALRALFDRHDSSAGTGLGAAELERVCAAMGMKLNKKSLAAAMAELDEAGAGDVSFEDFNAWWAANGGAELLAKFPAEDPDSAAIPTLAPTRNRRRSLELLQTVNEELSRADASVRDPAAGWSTLRTSISRGSVSSLSPSGSGADRSLRMSFEGRWVLLQL
eukprot:SAG22_NODE_77_length_22125_cov_46.140016_2_plen_298_part_00